MSRNQDCFLAWSTLRSWSSAENGTRLSSIFLGSLELMIIVIPWRYFSKSASKNILRHWTSKIRFFLILKDYFSKSLILLFAAMLYSCLFLCFDGITLIRLDRAKAVDILTKDLKVFSSFNGDLFKEITQLLTLDNFRYMFCWRILSFDLSCW